MSLFLITCLYYEGISPNLFCLVEAESRLAIAQHMLEHPEPWGYFLYRAFHQEQMDSTLTPEELLERIDRSHVDGDSAAQLHISDITVQSLAEVNTAPSFQPGTLFSDFG
ncbi:MAG: hypothetical protein Kow00121_49590 [Elainellaceae cyanobacterium]